MVVSLFFPRSDFALGCKVAGYPSRTRRADQGGIIFGLGSGRQQLAVFQSDRGIEFSGRSARDRRPHLCFRIHGANAVVNLGVIQISQI